MLLIPQSSHADLRLCPAEYKDGGGVEEGKKKEREGKEQRLRKKS